MRSVYKFDFGLRSRLPDSPLLWEFTFSQIALWPGKPEIQNGKVLKTLSVMEYYFNVETQ